MTPLLWEIMSHYTRPLRERAKEVLAIIEPFREGLVSFECSAVQEAVAEAVQFEIEEDETPDRSLVFLPAKATWLEKQEEDGTQIGFLLAQEDSFGFGYCAVFTGREDRAGGVYRLHARELGPLFKSDVLGNTHASWQEAFGKAAVDARVMQCGIRWILTFVNQPQIIGVKVHAAHKGRDRKLLRLGIGKFPLGAWTELVIGKPTKNLRGREVESRVADRRPLHFVRSHLKPSLGVRIPAHWRGNAAYGIRRSRYRLEERKDRHGEASINRRDAAGAP